DGDRVRVAFWRDVKDGRFEGGIEEVLERGKKWLVGVLAKHERKFLVECRQGKSSLVFYVDREDIQGARLGETVGIEVVDYPEGKAPGTARVIQLFGARGEESTEIDIVILKHQLPTKFPTRIRREAQAIVKDRKMDLSKGRRDLRKIPLVTIDGETARDFDDAICVKKNPKGYTLWVSIADVSHYIKPGSELDKEALARGTSVYFPQKVIPMLPEELSNDLCSLRPHEDRLAFTAELHFDSKGNLVGSEFYKSLIQSQARLTYTQVAKAMLDQDPDARKKIKESLPMLEQAFALFRKMRQKRLERGSIDFDLPEPNIILDLEEGNIESIVKSERNEAHMLIEEFMVAANEAVAAFVTQSKRPMVYRVHPKPDPEKVSNFANLLHNLGFHQAKLPKNPSPKDMGRVLELARGHVEEGVVQHFLLRSMKQAIYSPKNEGHYGLASDCYTHFTSPIRRYPDLVVHRILQSLLSQGPLQGTARSSELKKLEAVTVHASRRERIAMEAEWEA
ncbi:MAG: VacB/RNase II family 3'-5' exoribonuclease, partial [bacterium]|nr:VacB/RNase II family 3'-5' exoribonuclease [bacterium]